MLRKIIIYTVLLLALIAAGYFTIIYYATYSEGVRSGELIKFSQKGYVFKTWEGEISQGISGAQIFQFSVLDKDKEVVQKLQEYQGDFVKVTYIERYKTFAWWGDTKYFVIEVKPDISPFQKNLK